MNINLNKYIIKTSNTINDASKALFKNKIKFVVIVNSSEKVVGVFSEGEFSKLIYNNIDFKEKIGRFIYSEFIYVTKKNLDELPLLFKKYQISAIPELLNKKLLKIHYSKDFINKTTSNQHTVVVVAGGYGKRLRPITEIIPKALVPIQDKPILQIIIESFQKNFDTKFLFSLGYKSELIESYLSILNSRMNLKYKSYIEKKQLGTIGALSLMHKQLPENFFITNCDILINANYDEIFQFHLKNKASLTLIASQKLIQIPYGVCEFDKKGKLKKFKEKPEFEQLINVGFYVANKNILNFLKNKRKLDINELIDLLKKNNKKIVVYPISESAWTDIGQPELLIKQNV